MSQNNPQFPFSWRKPENVMNQGAVPKRFPPAPTSTDSDSPARAMNFDRRGPKHSREDSHANRGRNRFIRNRLREQEKNDFAPRDDSLPSSGDDVANLITSDEAVNVVAQFRLLHKLISQQQHIFNDAEGNLFGMDENMVFIFPNSMNLTTHITHAFNVASFVCNRLEDLLKGFKGSPFPGFENFEQLIGKFKHDLIELQQFESYPISHANGTILYPGNEEQIKYLKELLSALISHIRKSEYFLVILREFVKTPNFFI